MRTLRGFLNTFDQLVVVSDCTLSHFAWNSPDHLFPPAIQSWKFARLDWFVWGIKENISIDSNVELVSDRNFDRWLDIQILASDLRPGLTDFLPHGAGGDLGWARVLKDAAASALRKLESRAEYAR